ncbi:outer membrane beta-barrel protein [Carboxylicivirga sp. M1479]|uniref:outer membrane beta-barrel protein n=1 Tax=Carboxylicivirga sp. M1479 TaxID=2594476 RepID=UPI001177D8B6|nr:outer membrane beta-barrel protein [Carboxylicivirga sp. M1479]TRX70736.1 outer membrane beta-barrel protein [Carboxylicivirga sp. M1479]
MKKVLLVALVLFSLSKVYAQTDVYTVTSGELIFSWADVEQQVPFPGEMQDISSNLRFTAFFHVGQYVHMDFGDAVGLYSGLAIRNIGFITEDDALDLEKEKHRSYTLGLPLAIKLGSFRNHFYVFGGAEYELLFHYKYKYWIDGDKHKTSEWFSDRTNRFVPSVFAGIQLPRGLNVKFKYYLDDFLNTDYKKGDNPRNDYSRYGKTQMFYVSLSWQFDTRDLKKVWGGDDSGNRSYDARI